MPELTQAPENGNPQAEADLAVIRRLMEGARESTSYNGSYLILWGCLIAAAETITYMEGVGVVAAALVLFLAGPGLVIRIRGAAPAESRVIE